MTPAREDETQVATADADEPDAAGPSPEPARASQRRGGVVSPLVTQVEALLMSADRPLGAPRLAELLELPSDPDDSPAARVREAIDQLNAAYDATGRAVRIERLAGGWQILTRPEHGALLGRLHRDRQQTRLSPAALETLAIIGYRQPILRAEIEAIRGVACGEVLRGLLDRRLIKITGRAEELGRPMLYGTTREFLKVFGLASLDDLPEVEGLPEPTRRRRAASRPQPEAAEPEPEAADTRPEPAETEPAPDPEP